MASRSSKTSLTSLFLVSSGRHSLACWVGKVTPDCFSARLCVQIVYVRCLCWIHNCVAELSARDQEREPGCVKTIPRICKAKMVLAPQVYCTWHNNVFMLLHMAQQCIYFIAHGTTMYLFYCTWHNNVFILLHMAQQCIYFTAHGTTMYIFNCTWHNRRVFTHAYSGVTPPQGSICQLTQRTLRRPISCV